MAMYQTICPNCGLGYRDVTNRLYIAAYSKCATCILDDILNEGYDDGE